MPEITETPVSLSVFESNEYTQTFFHKNLEGKSHQKKIALTKQRIKLVAEQVAAIDISSDLYFLFDLENNREKTMGWLLGLYKKSSSKKFKTLFLDFFANSCGRTYCWSSLPKILPTLSKKRQDALLTDMFDNFFFHHFDPDRITEEIFGSMAEPAVKNDFKRLKRVLYLSNRMGFLKFSQRLFMQYKEYLKSDSEVLFEQCIYFYLVDKIDRAERCMKPMKNEFWVDLRLLYLRGLEGKGVRETFVKLDSYAKEFEKQEEAWYKPLLIKLLNGGDLTPKQIGRFVDEGLIKSNYQSMFIVLMSHRKKNFFSTTQYRTVLSIYHRAFHRSFLWKIIDGKVPEDRAIEVFGKNNMLSRSIR